MASFKQMRLPLVLIVLAALGLNWGLYHVIAPPQHAKPLDPAASFHLDFDQHYEGSGWQGIERTSDNVTFQWTRDPVATLILPLVGSGPLDVRFHISQRMTDAIQDSLRLSVNNVFIPLERDVDTYSGVIPAGALSSNYTSVTLVFETDPTIRPGDLDMLNRDARTLGVAFDWLDIGPHGAPVTPEATP